MPSGAGVIRYEGKRGVVWRIKYRDADGRQVGETIGAEANGFTKKDAEAELRERLVKVERKDYRRPKTVGFREYAETWFAEGPSRRRWKPNTIRTYVFVHRRLAETFGAMPLGSIRPRHVAEFAAEHEGGASTISRDLAILHAILDSARREELIDSNPAERIERPKQPRRKWRILEPHEVRTVSGAFTDDRARRVFLTTALTGVRRSELQALRWAHVDLLVGTLRVVESKSEEGERLIALPSTLVRELSDHYAATPFKADRDLVFAHPKLGTKVDDQWYKRQFDAALAVAGITERVRSFHDMRHTAITNDAAAGSSAIAVMSKAGHRNMSTTQRYLHLAGVVFRNEADALERRLLGTVENPVESSTDLASPEPVSPDTERLYSTVSASAA